MCTGRTTADGNNFWYFLVTCYISGYSYQWKDIGRPPNHRLNYSIFLCQHWGSQLVCVLSNAEYISLARQLRESISESCYWPAVSTKTYSISSTAFLGISYSHKNLWPSYECDCFAVGGLLKIPIIEATSEIWFNLFWETLQRNLVSGEKTQTKPKDLTKTVTVCSDAL